MDEEDDRVGAIGVVDGQFVIAVTDLVGVDLIGDQGRLALGQGVAGVVLLGFEAGVTAEWGRVEDLGVQTADAHCSGADGPGTTLGEVVRS